ncbi:MAG TPA: hypothetical protein PLM53_01010 [Spirochaetota bacterium]|nr:hypothetical protein [Spirochaetota bacterium]HPC39398.1 hypothetical protein [Spirochaetota bacterium]HPL16885.1 hypothetical protein [Spirochaetota bacterium]HQF06735.1 hypothetical protein [Spirochaetota bacterium]HQH95646.1 hypothetical protein [Spirochaetota bacterium]
MKLLVDAITLNPGEDQSLLKERVREIYGIDREFDLTIARKSLDARKKDRIVYRYRVIIDIEDAAGKSLLTKSGISVYEQKIVPAIPRKKIEERVLIAGSGPAGLFCALRLIEAGAAVEIFERGKAVEERMRDIEMLERQGVLNERSNVLFGEGGAGTYSDGKLTSRTRRPEIDWFFTMMVECGAPPSILYEAKPHIGTDRLRVIVAAIRRMIVSSGSQVHFNESVDDIIVYGGSLRGVITSQGREVTGSRLVMAIGHSARDTYEMLSSRGVALERKGFAMGVRIEHPAELINEIQYGRSPYRDQLPAADYALTAVNRSSGRGIYSFCMCPGGRIINSSSEQERLCTNGMSFSKRNHPFSNAAIVVTVSPDDFGADALGGISLQRAAEADAYAGGGGSFTAPAQRVTSFLSGMIDAELPPVSYRPGVVPADLARHLPAWLADELKTGLAQFDRKMKGFVSNSGVLVGVETRTSSPVRITRNSNFQSVAVRGLYPVGEGAGYAGGIVSSAVDGIRCADAILGE